MDQYRSELIANWLYQFMRRSGHGKEGRSLDQQLAGIVISDVMETFQVYLADYYMSQGMRVD